MSEEGSKVVVDLVNNKVRGCTEDPRTCKLCPEMKLMMGLLRTPDEPNMATLETKAADCLMTQICRAERGEHSV